MLHRRLVLFFMNYQYKKTISKIFIFLFICTFCFSQTLQTTKTQSQQSHPSIEPLFLPEDVLVNTNNSDGKLSADEVFEFSLLFSECPQESAQWRDCFNKFEQLKQKVQSADFLSLTPEELGRAILKLLYQDCLTTYSFNQTRTNVALQTGVYNCVSSALLYMAVAKAAGLDVRGQKTSEHAFCTVYIPIGTGGKTNQYKKIDVETTNPYGFNPGSKETIENEDKIQTYYVVPKKYYSNRQEVSDSVFAGLIAGNICAECIEQDNYEKAIPLGATRYEFVRSEKSKVVNDVRRDFDVLASNYVNIDIEDARLFSGYVEWFTGFIDRWGMTDYLQKNMDTALYNLLVLCLQQKDFHLAEASFNKFKPYVTQKQTSTLQELLADIFFDSGLEDLSAEEQIVLINQTLSLPQNQDEAFQKRAQLYLENAWLMVLNNCMNLRDYETGFQKSEEALKQFPKSSKIKKMQKAFYDNCIAIIHNNFADEANAQHFDQARQILEAGLQVFPDDKTLKNDLNLLNKMTAN